MPLVKNEFDVSVLLWKCGPREEPVAPDDKYVLVLHKRLRKYMGINATTPLFKKTARKAKVIEILAYKPDYVKVENLNTKITELGVEIQEALEMVAEEGYHALGATTEDEVRNMLKTLRSHEKSE